MKILIDQLSSQIITYYNSPNMLNLMFKLCIELDHEPKENPYLDLLIATTLISNLEQFL